MNNFAQGLRTPQTEHEQKIWDAILVDSVGRQIERGVRYRDAVPAAIKVADAILYELHINRRP